MLRRRNDSRTRYLTMRRKRPTSRNEWGEFYKQKTRRSDLCVKKKHSLVLSHCELAKIRVF